MTRISSVCGVTRRALTALLLTAGLTGGSGNARAADAIEQPVFDFAVVRDPQLGAQAAIADALGYFRDEGLTVTIRWQNSGADIIQLMVGGNADVATASSFPQVVMAGQKAPVRTIATLADISATQGFALGPGVVLKDPKELEGKKIAYTPGTPSITLLAKMSKTFGFDMSKVTLVNMQQPEAVVASSKGDVQGMLGWQPNLYRLTTLGGTLYATGTTLYTAGEPKLLPADDQLQYNHSVLVATQAWIAEKPNTLKAMIRALKRATDLINTDREKALAALQPQVRVDMDALKVMVEANRYGLAIDEAVARSTKSQSEWAYSIKRIPAPADLAEVYAPALLKAVYPDLVTWAPAR